MDTITGMRTFCAVASEESFIKAAKRLGFSAALTSKYVGQLEERLGVRLLNRTTRSLGLTENGAAYYKRCLLLLEEFDELEAGVQDLQRKPAGQLLVSAPITIGEAFLSKALVVFFDKYPDISIDLRLSNRFVNIVEEGFDVAIRMGSLKDSGLIAKKLAATEIVLCATPQFLEQNPALDHPNDLTAHSCIIDTNFVGGNHWPFIIDGKKAIVRVSGRAKANSATVTRTLLLENLGIALIPGHVVAEDIKAGRLVRLLEDFNAFKPSRPDNLGLYAIYPHSRHLATKVRVFVDFLAQYFSSYPTL